MGRGMDSLRVILVDDSALFREGLAGLLAQTEIKVIGHAATCDEAMVRVAATSPDVVVMDIRLPPTFTDEGLGRRHISKRSTLTWACSFSRGTRRCGS